MLYILLDHPTNVQDVTFNTMQVITLISGVLGVAGGYFANKYEVEKLKAAKLALKKTLEKENEERKAEIEKLEKLMNKRVDAANEKIKELDTNIGTKLDKIQTEVKEIHLKLGENHNALLQALLNKEK